MTKAQAFVKEFAEFDGGSGLLRCKASAAGARIPAHVWDAGEARSYAFFDDGSCATWRDPKSGFDLLIRDLSNISRSSWKLSELASGESVAVVARGPFKGMEIPFDWSQGAVRPATKAERLASIVGDDSLVRRHQAMFAEGA